jgi:outer membrane protein OmpA-like peptidoglycan-associated protein
MKKISALFFLSFLALTSHVLYGQQQSAYFPHTLGQQVNSVYDDINPVLSPDGKTLFFVRVNHPENTFGEYDSEDIWFSELQPDGAWSSAQRIDNLNIGRYNAVMSVSSDGNTLLLNGVYNKKGNIFKKRGLSTSTREGKEWGTPVRLNVSKYTKRNRGLKSSGMMTADGQNLILSFTRTYNGKRSNLFVSEKKENGKFGRPRPIRPLNSKEAEDSPFLLADNKTLYFSSDYETKGNYEIYRVTRMADGWKNWSDPVRLSDTINSEGWDSWLKTNVKGSWGYFSSNNKGNGSADIFKVKIFEENPYVVVSGRIVHAKNNKPMVGRNVTIKVNGANADSVKVNTDSATYKVVLPLRKVYRLSAAARNYKEIPETVDVSSVREFTTLDLNLRIDPLPYVSVRGKLLTSQGQVIPASANPQILVDGKPADSVSIDPVTGIYSMKLKYGASHNIQVKANRFEPQPVVLNLSKIDDYQEITQNLTVNEEKMAIVTGKIIDKKTSRQLAAGVPANVKVEGMPSVIPIIDQAAGTYEIRLPLGAAYTISAAAPNYYPVYEPINVTYERTNVKIYRDLVIVPIEVGQTVRLNNIFFETGKSTLKRESFPELDRVIKFMKENSDIRIEIGGHTDNVGKAATNLKLSQTRAKAVATYMTSNGVSSSRIVSKGYGLTKPVASNKTKEGKSQNRRVEFKILDK